MQEDNTPVSIFSYTGSNAQDARLAAARNGAKRLRVVSSLSFIMKYRLTRVAFSQKVGKRE